MERPLSTLFMNLPNFGGNTICGDAELASPPTDCDGNSPRALRELIALSGQSSPMVRQSYWAAV